MVVYLEFLEYHDLLLKQHLKIPLSVLLIVVVTRPHPLLRVNITYIF